MLFRRDINPACAYCQYATRDDNIIKNREMICKKRGGVMPIDYHCRAFRYDPFKRVPPRPAGLSIRTRKLKPEDFALE